MFTVYCKVFVSVNAFGIFQEIWVLLVKMVRRVPGVYRDPAWPTVPEIASCSPSTVRHKTSLIALVDPVKSTLGTHSFLSTPTNGDTAKILVWYIHTYTSSYLKITTLSLHIEYDCIWFVCFFVFFSFFLF